MPVPTVAYVLVAHGSRDPRARVALDNLLVAARDRLPQRISRTSVRIAIAAATLEFADTPLPEAITSVVRRTEAQNVRLVPLFLQAGVHAREDIPTAACQARELLGETGKIETLPFLGARAQLEELLAVRFAGLFTDPTTARPHRLLVAHGSRRPGGNEPVAELAARLDATLAFWAIAPDLETQVAALVAKGARAIAIAPYFLFPGAIADAIAARVEVLRANHPEISMALASPLSETPHLSQLIIDTIVTDYYAVYDRSSQR